MKHKKKHMASKSPMMSQPMAQAPMMPPSGGMSSPSMMKAGGSIGSGPVGTGGMKNPNQLATCNAVNQ